MYRERDNRLPFACSAGQPQGRGYSVRELINQRNELESRQDPERLLYREKDLRKSSTDQQSRPAQLDRRSDRGQHDERVNLEKNNQTASTSQAQGSVNNEQLLTVVNNKAI